MKTVYSAPNLALVSIFRNILEAHGIPCRITNEFLSSGLGEIPPIECWPQLRVEDDAFAEASRIVQENLAEDDQGAAWRCGACGEDIEGQFAQCWKCGKSRPD